MTHLRAVYLAFNQLEAFGHRVRYVPCADFATMLTVPTLSVLRIVTPAVRRKKA